MKGEYFPRGNPLFSLSLNMHPQNANITGSTEVIGYQMQSFWEGAHKPNLQGPLQDTSPFWQPPTPSGILNAKWHLSNPDLWPKSLLQVKGTSILLDHAHWERLHLDSPFSQQAQCVNYSGLIKLLSSAFHLDSWPYLHTTDPVHCLPPPLPLHPIQFTTPPPIKHMHGPKRKTMQAKAVSCEL